MESFRDKMNSAAISALIDNIVWRSLLDVENNENNVGWLNRQQIWWIIMCTMRHDVASLLDSRGLIIDVILPVFIKVITLKHGCISLG